MVLFYHARQNPSGAWLAACKVWQCLLHWAIASFGVLPQRVSLWNDICKHHQELEGIRAIQDFDSADVTVEQGDTKTSVYVTDYVTPVAAMEKLYMVVYVS